MAQNPNPSLLDPGQIIKRAFDGDNDRIRVETEISTVNISGNQQILITDDVDSIKIGDGNGHYLKVNTDGSINVDASISSAEDYGSSTQALRTASQIGNSTGQADFNSGPSTNQTLRTSSNLNDGSGNGITSSASNANRILHSQTPDATSPIATLGSLNASVIIPLAGLTSVGFQLNPGTLTGTLTAFASVDGGSQYTPVPFYDPANAAVLPNLPFTGGTNPLKIVSIIPIGGSSHVKVQVTNYTSGTASGLLRAANVTGAAGAVTASAFSVVVNTYPNLIANTPTLILPANVNRKYAYIANSSSSTARMQFFTGAGLSSSTGIPIDSQNYVELKGDNLFTGDIYAFCSSTISISVAEGTP